MVAFTKHHSGHPTLRHRSHNFESSISSHVKYHSPVKRITSGPKYLCFRETLGRVASENHVTIKPHGAHARRRYFWHLFQVSLQYIVDSSTAILVRVSKKKTHEIWKKSRKKRFLDSSTHLCKRLCPSVRQSVCPSIGPSVRNHFNLNCKSG